MKQSKKITLFCLIVASLCSSCSLRGSGGSKTIYNVRFNLATAGNCLNPDIYSPENGPAGFVSYKSLFTSCYVYLDYDSKINFSCTYSDGSTYAKTGTYSAGLAGTGNILTAVYAVNDVVTYYWPNYYQFYATEVFNLPGLGPTEVTVLYHATIIFG